MPEAPARPFQIAGAYPASKSVLAALLALTFAFSCHAETIVGEVVGVSDGDTVTVLDGAKTRHKIRLSGIDAPEKKQPFGQRSKESLSRMVFGKSVSVETVKKDRYGRDLGKVIVDGKDANLEQLNRGMAWHYKAYAREQPMSDRAKYAATEQLARDARRGLWKDTDPVPPWEFRRTKPAR